MRIMILGTAWPYRGGIAAFNERLAYEFIKAGHEVEIVTFTLQYPSFLFPGKTQYSDAPSPEGLKIVRMINSCNPFNWLKVGRYVRKQKIDLLITPFWIPFMAPCFGTILRRAKNTKSKRVAILHNLIPHEHRIGDNQFAAYFVKSNDAFVTLSKSVLDDIDKFDPSHSRPRLFAPHPIYDHYGQLRPKAEARHALGLQEDSRYVLFFGFIRQYKGLDILLDAIADNRLAQLGVKLIVAGEFYGDSQPYFNQIKRLGIEDRVILKTSFIPDSDVNLYFSAADIVAQPYRTATQSGVTQIAYHFAKPMLVTNVGGLPEIVPDGKVGYVVEPDAKHIADGLYRFYDQNCESRFVEGAQREKENYSWQRMTETIALLLNECSVS